MAENDVGTFSKLQNSCGFRRKYEPMMSVQLVPKLWVVGIQQRIAWRSVQMLCHVWSSWRCKTRKIVVEPIKTYKKALEAMKNHSNAEYHKRNVMANHNFSMTHEGESPRIPPSPGGIPDPPVVNPPTRILDSPLTWSNNNNLQNIKPTHSYKRTLKEHHLNTCSPNSLLGFLTYKITKEI